MSCPAGQDLTSPAPPEQDRSTPIAGALAGGGAGAIGELRRRLQAGLRTTLVGSDAPIIDLTRRTDEGLFGPGSATWAVHGDAAVLIGGIRALLMQTLHPRAMAGVADHSQYRSDPTGRLWRTARYVAITSFGTTAEATAAVRAVERVHQRVVGSTPDGRPYSASDPELLSFVHATLVESFAVAADRFGPRRLTTSDLDRYVAEQQRLAALFGIEDFPTSWSGLGAYLGGLRPELRATPAARDAVRFLIAPPLAVHLRPAYAVLAAAAGSTLPWWARRRLRLPVLPVTERLIIRPSATALTRMLAWALEAPAPDASAPGASGSAPSAAPGSRPDAVAAGGHPTTSAPTTSAAPIPRTAIERPSPVPVAKRSQAASPAARNSSSPTAARTRSTARRDAAAPPTARTSPTNTTISRMARPMPGG
jgi:uncharacterized protein (DUF2236 family)